MNALKPTAIVTAAALVFVGGIAQAQDGYGHNDAYHQDGYGQNGYRQDTAEVLSSRPIYRDVRVNEPRQECYQQQVQYNEGGYYDNRGSFLGTLIGGVVGGVVGHNFGRGGGRTAATVVGAVVGAGAGNAIGSQHDAYYGGGERVGYQDRCDTVNHVHYEQRPSGYDVTYRYHGQVYHTETQYDPGDRIPVNVSVTPSGY